MNIQPSLLDPVGIAGIDTHALFEEAWYHLPVKSRAGLSKDERIAQIYAPFQDYLYLSSGMWEYFEGLGLRGKDVLREVLRVLPRTTYERWLRARMEQVERDEKRLEVMRAQAVLD